MLDTLSGIFDVFWHIIVFCWNVITWALHAEERLLIIFDGWGWSTWKQIIVISPINVFVLGWDIFWFYHLAKIRKVLRIIWIFVNRRTPITIRVTIKLTWLWFRGKLPQKLRNIDKDQLSQMMSSVSRGRPFGPVDLAIIALIPECQKVACFIFATKPSYFGWRGFLALCIAGTIRLAVTAALPMEWIWGFIAAAILYRVVKFFWARKKVKDSDKED